MTPYTVARGDRRAMLIGTAVVLALLLALRGVPAWRAWRSQLQGSAAELTAELQRAEASVATSGRVADSLRARKARFLALAPALVAGDSPAGSAAALASLVSGVAATSGLRVGAMQVRADTAGAGMFVRVGVRADVVGDVRGVSLFLATLEHGPVMLRVRELSIAQPEPSAPADRAEALRVELLVEGLAFQRPRGTGK